MKVLITALAAVLISCPGYAVEYHVSSTGFDGTPGSDAKPFRTISAAAAVAEPGDSITVHEGVYRERVNPGLADNLGGDERFFNNLIVNEGLAGYDAVTLPMFLDGNVYLNGAKPSKHESDPLVLPNIDPGAQLVEEDDGLYLQLNHDEAWMQRERRFVTTKLLGNARTPDLPYLDYDGAALSIDTNYFGDKRNTVNPAPGPFRVPEEGSLLIKVWPRK